MLMRDFVKQVQQSLANIQNYDDSKLKPHEFLEGQRHLDELKRILASYADSNIVITKENYEECFQPFFDFLASRWIRIAETNASYKNAPQSKANLYARMLSQQLIMAMQKLEYKNRDLNAYLMPSITITMKNFIDNALIDIDLLQTSTPEYVDPFINYESNLAIANLKEVLSSLPQTDSPVTLDLVQPLIAFMHHRYLFTAGTEADYLHNQNSDANIIFKHIANFIYFALGMNKQSRDNLSVNRMLMPSIHPDSHQASLRSKLLGILESAIKSSEVDNKWLAVLRAQKTTTQAFVSRMKSELAKLEKDDAETTPLLALLESHQAIRRFKEILSDQLGVDGQLTKPQLQAYVDFLSQRWNVIDGTEASYTAEPALHTRANRLCKELADHLMLAAYELDYLNRDQQFLLMRTPHHDVKPEVAANQLRLAVTSAFNDLNALADEMLKLPQSSWKAFVDLFEQEKRVNLLSSGKSSLADVIKTTFEFDQNERRSKAILVYLFLTYERERQKVASAHTGYGASLAGMFVSIPTLEQKTRAVDAVCDRLLSGASLADIAAELKDEKSALYPHRAALQDKRLKSCWDQLELAASKLPAPEVFPVARIVAHQ